MSEERYAASRVFVKEMRAFIARRDLVSIRQAVQQMQNWMQEYPDDLYVGTALEEFDILEEAARMVENHATTRSASAMEPTAKAS